jgi:tyrosine-protein kinase Etk/Wzc
MLRRHRLWVALCVLLTVAAGQVYTLRAPRVYEASSVLRFELEEVNLPQLVQQLSTENRISTEIQVLNGRSAAAAVIDSLGLRARLVAPRRAQISKLFSMLRVVPGSDTLTLVLRAGQGGTLTMRRLEPPHDVVPVRIGDTVKVGGLTFALAPAAREVTELGLRVESMPEAVARFQSNLQVSRPDRDADLITVQVRSSDPDQAAAAANLLTEQLISGRHDVQLARTGSTIQFLKHQLDTLGTQLGRAENDLRAYRERSGAVDVEEEARTQVRRLAQVEADRSAVEAERQALAELVRQMRSDSARALSDGQANSRDLVSFPTLLKNEAASQLLAARAQVENERATLLVRRKPEDPDVQVLTNRIREIDAQLQGIAETYLQGLTNQVGALGDVARNFGGALNTLPKKEVQTARLEREVKVQQELYTLIQTRLKEAEITRAMEDPSVRIVDPAVVPTGPVAPRPLIILALSVVLGSLLGVITAVGRGVTDRSIRTRADALLAAGLPVVGAIPRLEGRPIRLLPRTRQRRTHSAFPSSVARLQSPQAVGGDPHGTRVFTFFGPSATGQTPATPHRSHRNRPLRAAAARIESRLVTRRETPAAYIESLNQLHANLLFASQERPPKVLVFTSPLPGEGKTLSIINFALTLAGRDLRVLLIDADFRRGLVNEVFGCERAPGFAELLAGTARFEHGAHRVAVGETGELVILPAGALPSNQRQIMTIEGVREVLEPLAPAFDVVLIDSPPINLLADAALLGSAADAVVLVVRAGQTQVDAVRFAMEQLTAARAPVVGTLLNDIDLRRNSDDDGSYRYLVELERYYAGPS